MATAEQALATLDKLTERLRRRSQRYEELDRRYRGEVGKLAFASEQFSKYFESRYKSFSDNWCAIVADAPVERLEVVGIRLDETTELDQDLWRTWRSNEADALSDLAFLEAVVTSRAFALVWGDSDDQPVITWEHPSQAIVDYDPETRARTAGAKVWADRDAGIEYATLYLPDAVWKWQRPTATSGLVLPASVTAAGGWVPREVPDEPWPLNNPLGVVPLVELQNRPRLVGPPLSDIEGAAAMQDAINLLWAYLFNAADYGSFKQRVILGGEYPKIPVLDENGVKIGDRKVDIQKFAVDRVLWLEDPESKIDEWSETPLENYSKVLELCVRHLAAQTRTPANYILAELVNVSAEAIKLTETGLVARTREKTEHLGRGVREVFRLACLVQGEAAKAAQVAAGQVLWRDVETRSEAQTVDALQKLKAIGLPTRYLLERLGLDPTEVVRVMDMITDEAASDPVAALAGLVKAGPENPAESGPEPAGA